MSMSSALAWPPSSSRIASSEAAKRIRLTMNPQISFLRRTGVRSMLRTNSIAVWTVSSVVFGPRTTSHSCMTVTGWKKCMLQQRSGCPVMSASRLIAMVLELLARTASGLACLPSSSKTLLLASMFSITVFILEERSRDGLMGLYEGAGALGAGEGLPERITLYKHSHEQASRSYRELVEEVRRTILHEVGHHFGMEEDDLPY